MNIMHFKPKRTFHNDQRIVERVEVVFDPVRIIRHIELSTVEMPLEVVPDDVWMKPDARHG